MLADFAVRLAFGLAVALLLTAWRSGPLFVFRAQALVVLGLLVLAALDQARHRGQSWAFWLLVAGAVLSYIAAVAWGLGASSLGKSAAALVALAAALWTAGASQSTIAPFWALGAASRLASGFLMGATLAAMLLGHSYLISPTMSIGPLKRLVNVMAWALLARLLLAGAGLWLARNGPFAAGTAPVLASQGLVLVARWGLGFGGTAGGTYMAWKTVQLKSTQSATGILYITMIFVLFGELTSLWISGASGVIC
jgi:hypothetical protein